MLQVRDDHIPSSLRSVPNWVVWKTCARRGQLTKLPFQVNGQSAKTNDSSTWSDFQLILARYAIGNYCGVGFVFSTTDEFCGIEVYDAKRYFAVTGWKLQGAPSEPERRQN